MFNIPKFSNIILYLVLLFLLQSCSTGGYSVDAYKSIGSELKKEYKLSRSDLIVAYDLNRIDGSNCIYSQELGKVINDKKHRTHYITRFKKLYKSPAFLKSEAKRKIMRINRLLLRLHHDNLILTQDQHSYLKDLSRTNLSELNIRSELDRLDKIISFIPVMVPVDSTEVTSKYGNRFHPIKKREIFHCGLDMVAKTGSKVYASANGIVTFAGKKPGYGNIVEIKHNKYLMTRYAHLKKIFVKKGRAVPRGKAIGIQGATGSATGDHLHFEVWVRDKHVNPYNFVASECKCRR